MPITETLSIALPEIILAVSALTLLVIGAVGGAKTSAAVSWLSILTLIGAAIAAAVAPLGSTFSGGFVSDAASVYAKVAIYGMSAVGVFLGDAWLGRLKARQFEYPILILLAAIGMGMMASAGDLISLYIGVELQSLSLYVLAAFRRDDAKASEAGLKYFVLGALSSGLLLYGASLIYGFAGSTRFDVIATAVTGASGTGVLFGVVFLICGLAFKVSAAPFHMWTPDVYEGAPTPVVGFFTAAPKLAAMVLFMRALYDGFPGAIDQWRQIIVVIAIASVLVGAFAGLVQQNIKRLLAYSSIANVGYALIGMAAGNHEGAQAVLVFMALYMIDATGFFAVLTALSRKGVPMERLSDMAGLSKSQPGLAFVLTLLSFSVMGIPPLPGFFGKFYVFKAALNADMPWLAVIGLVASVVSAFYYLRLVKVMWLDPSPGETDAPPADAKSIAFACGLFALPGVAIALVWIDPLAKTAAQALGLH
ncbi:NADH-quinone oxidoreductase subunit NuoN [soil metagenome]